MLYCRYGGDNTVKILDEVEVKEFVERYMSNYKEDIIEVKYTDLNGLKSYLVNGHYLVMTLGDKIVEYDLKF